MLTPSVFAEGVMTVDEWAEIRRLHRSEAMAIKAIARRVGVARNTVRAALAADEPPRYSRAPAGSSVDAFEPAIRLLLKEFPDMAATVIAERVAWTGAPSVLRARVAQLRPLFAGPDPADRTVYAAGDVVQCDLWFPGRVVPVGERVLADPPVLTMVAAYSGFIMAVLLPSRTTGDLLAGMWALLSGLGAVPKTLVWDNEPGIGQRQRLTMGARSFAGTLGTRIYQTPPRDPESKGVVERTNGFLETSFMPGRSFTGPADYNTQLAAWLPRANTRLLRRTGEQPAVRVAADTAAMTALPPLPPAVGTSSRVRLARDYYVRVAGNDYSVHPGMIGRFVDVHAGLERVVVSCAGEMVADHTRRWSTRQTVTDPAHVAAAKVLRAAYQARTAASRGPAARAGIAVGVRALSDYDTLFGIGSAASDVPGDPPQPRTPKGRPDLRVLR
jgi:transposase